MSKIKWIYIEDDLPPGTQTIVTYKEYGVRAVKSADYIGMHLGRPCWIDGDGRGVPGVIAWAEMPEPAKPRGGKL